jgi:group II intron reverse transcriptase/maturase
LVIAGHSEVVDADLKGYFDSIPHAELMKSVSRRISDRHMLRLIKQWLQAPVEEHDERGNRRRTTRNKDEGRGIPQGAPISPLLSNIYMRRFILGWKQLGCERRWGAHVVNYADDLVICCRGRADHAKNAMVEMMRKLRLTVNEAKTRVCQMPRESFDFLGYTVGQHWSVKMNRFYLGTRPSQKGVQRLCREISDLTSRRTMLLNTQDRVQRLNRTLTGWADYFCLGSVSKAYRAIDEYTRRRLRQWLCRKHQLGNTGKTRFPDQYLYDTLGLVRLEQQRRKLPWAKA